MTTMLLNLAVALLSVAMLVATTKLKTA